MVKVKDMVVGKFYKNVGKLVNMEMSPGGAGGSGNQEASFALTFENQNPVTKEWDDVFDEVTGGGRRKSRRNKKSRKPRRKSTRR